MTVFREIGRKQIGIQKNVFECERCDLILAEEFAKRGA